jgi:hypothetical protein
MKKISYNGLTGMITNLKRTVGKNFNNIPDNLKKEIYRTCRDYASDIDMENDKAIETAIAENEGDKILANREGDDE